MDAVPRNGVALPAWRRLATPGAVAVYFAATLTVSYALWGPYDGVEYDPAWATEARVWAALLIVHVLVGAAIGRWWALGLPLAWALLSWPAEGYDTPVWIGIAFTTPVYWIPALAAGLLFRWSVARLRRGDARPAY